MSIEFLKQYPLFKRLKPVELAALSTSVEEIEAWPGSPLFYQRDAADALIIILSGSLEASTLKDDGTVEQVRYLFPGDMLESEWLLLPGVHHATVRARELTRLGLIHRKDFMIFLKEHPGAYKRLKPVYDQGHILLSGLTEPLWEVLKRKQPGAGSEQVLYHGHPSRRKLMFSICSILFLETLVILSAHEYGLSAAKGTPLSLLWFGVLGFSGLLILLLLSKLVQRAVHSYILTDRILTHRYVGFRNFYIKTDQIPLDQIQGVDVKQSHILNRLLNVGHLTVRTSALEGDIILKDVDAPVLLQQKIFNLKKLSVEFEQGRDQAMIRERLEEWFHASPSHKVIRSRQNHEGSVVSSRAESGRIRFRKSPVVLLLKILLPLASAAGILFLLRTQIIPPGWWSRGLYGFTVISLFWLLWVFLDWVNDLYFIEKGFVVDIDRKPFGWSQERKQAQLGQVQNIHAVQKGFLAFLFNYGHVEVETGGSDSDITFEYVIDPWRVQGELFRQREETRRGESRQERDQNMEDMVRFADVLRQEEEQGRFPRRTPVMPGTDEGGGHFGR